MARGAIRGALSGALALLVLQTVTTSRGSRAVSSGFDTFADLVERAFSPDVPAIPNRAHAAGRQEDPPTTTAPPAAAGTESKFDRIPGVND